MSAISATVIVGLSMFSSLERLGGKIVFDTGTPYYRGLVPPRFYPLPISHFCHGLASVRHRFDSKVSDC